MGTTCSAPIHDPIGDTLRGDPDLCVDSFPKSEGQKVTVTTTTTGKDGREKREERIVGYEQYGESIEECNDIILFFHGTPGTRFFFSSSHSEYARTNKVHVIVPERPGFGLSTYKEDRTIRQSARDANYILNQVMKNKSAAVHVMGYSAGGPYALAFAYDFPNTCKSVSIISSLSPNEKGILKNVDLLSKIGYFLASHFPLIFLSSLIHYLIISTSKKTIFDHSRDDFTDEENSIFQNNEPIRKLFIKSTLELYSQPHSAKTEALDYKLVANYWGFDLNEIKGNFNIWVYGAGQDFKSTPQMYNVLINQLPNEMTKEVFVEEANHLYFYKLFEERLLTDIGIINKKEK